MVLIIKPIRIKIKERQWKRIGYALRKKKDEAMRAGLEWTPRGKAGEDGWRRTVLRQLELAKKTWGGGGEGDARWKSLLGRKSLLGQHSTCLC